MVPWGTMPYSWEPLRCPQGNIYDSNCAKVMISVLKWSVLSSALENASLSSIGKYALLGDPKRVCGVFVQFIKAFPMVSSQKMVAVNLIATLWQYKRRSTLTLNALIVYVLILGEGSFVCLFILWWLRKMVHCNVENMTEMDCLKVKTRQGSPPLGHSHLSRHYWPLFTIVLSWLPSSARGNYTDRESCTDL